MHDDDSADYVRFDQRSDVVASLDLLGSILPMLKQNAGQWKWAIIAAHSSVQGALVCALANTHGWGAFLKKNQKKYSEWADADFVGPQPSDWLAEFPTLLDWATEQGALSLPEPDKRALLRLNEYRTGFVHFKPGGWSIEAAGLPLLLEAAARATCDLMLHDRVRIHLSDEEIAKIQTVPDFVTSQNKRSAQPEIAAPPF